MSDETSQDTGKRSRQARTKRDFIDGNGQIVDSMEKSAGARVGVLSDDGKTVLQSFDYVQGKNPFADLFFANMGFHTKAGNVINTVINNDKEPGDASTACETLAEFLEDVYAGVWAERTGGGPAKIDRDKLAEAVVQAMIETGRLKADDAAGIGEKRQVAREKMDSDRKWLATVRKQPNVARLYAQLVGAREISADEAFAGL